ncbi:hypothetical protein LSH36_766g02001 [Paralvinella palmiformis]|uniref:GRIP1-associated protein 1 n=1 Tax=Paralvinella palmiformis TaxID=53620 RepID=A0AAD9J1G3_9ANNE|nr:hypothetical protein LSH36_766g02001 [Paralvinella palmiformis]
MASALSEDEFHRMQLQLLELRTENYKVTDHCKRQERELNELRTLYETKDKELLKATKVINKSKKAREVELLELENDGLQRKLQTQEEEFRLQNETIMAELSQVIRTNEALEKEVESLKSFTGNKDVEQTEKLQDEIRRLQAQNSVLQKNLTACQGNHETELTKLRQTVVDMELQCLKLSGQRGSPVGQGSTDARTVEGEDDPEFLTYHQADGEEAQTDNCLPEDVLRGSDKTDHVSAVVSGLDNISIHVQLEEQSELISDLQLRLDTEQEEKKLIKEQMLQAEVEYKEKIKSLQDEVEKISEKFKKKQESLVQLQEEKELIYTELSNRIHEVEEVKDSEINKLKTNSIKLQEELSQCNMVLEEYEGKSATRIQELEQLINNLENRQLETQNVQFNQQLTTLNKQLIDLKKINDQLETQLKENQTMYNKKCEELEVAQQELDRQTQALQESHKVAEKRKSLLDELAIKYQEESDQHREQIKSMEETHNSEIDVLTERVDQLKVQVTDFDQIKQTTNDLRTQVNSLEKTKQWLERRLDEAEELLKETKKNHEESVNKQEEYYEKQIEKISEENDNKVKELTEQTEALRCELVEKNSQIEALKQEIKDKIEDKKICEKKGATMERLQEYLADTKSRQCNSVSSWNASILSRENTLMSPEDEAPPVSLTEENAELLKRITDLQQEKWMLEEKVSHLESSNSCMAEDLLQKTAVIEHYVMDSHIGEYDLETLSQEIVRLSKQVVIGSSKQTSGEQKSSE